MMYEKVVEDGRLEERMTGEEVYPIIEGGTLTATDVAAMIQMFRGFPLYAGCFEKARAVQYIYGGDIHLGAMRVVSDDGTSAYGFDYNPPRELHAWIKIGIYIFDLSLPGVIMRGSMLEDEYGPFLKGREPSVLCGPPPDWLIYKSAINITKEEIWEEQMMAPRW